MDPYSAYCWYYEAQSGGELPVFRGGLQSGEGIGDFFRGLLRFVAPIAMRGIKTFAGNVTDAHQKGATLKDAAKGALKPTLGAVASSIGEQLQARNDQAGSGALTLLRKRKLKSLQADSVGKRRKVYKKHPVKQHVTGHFKSAEHNHLNY